MTGFEQTLLALVSGGIIGVSLGVTGSGGSLIAIPLLVYVVHVNVHQATAISLIIVGTTAWLGVFQHTADRTIRPKAALVFSGPGMGSAWVGASMHHLVREEVLLMLLGGLMLVGAVLMVKQAGSSATSVPGECAEQFPHSCWFKVSGAGIVIGFLTGFLGVGGGFLIVPTLILLLGFPTALAVGTSLLIIALVTVGGLIGHLQFEGLNWRLLGWLLAGSTIGMLLGSRLGSAVSQATRLRVFAMIAMGIGLMLVVHNGTTLLAG